jgi:hypothetical protein
MDENAALYTLWWMTVAKIFIGMGLGAVLLGSLYKFKRVIMTTFGVLLLSNLIVLYLVIAMLSN